VGAEKYTADFAASSDVSASYSQCNASAAGAQATGFFQRRLYLYNRTTGTALIDWWQGNGGVTCAIPTIPGSTWSSASAP
jgi:hypothetical protein